MDPFGFQLAPVQSDRGMDAFQRLRGGMHLRDALGGARQRADLDQLPVRPEPRHVGMPEQGAAPRCP